MVACIDYSVEDYYIMEGFVEPPKDYPRWFSNISGLKINDDFSLDVEFDLGFGHKEKATVVFADLWPIKGKEKELLVYLNDVLFPVSSLAIMLLDKHGDRYNVAVHISCPDGSSSNVNSLLYLEHLMEFHD